MEITDRILTEKEVKDITGLGRTTRWKLEREGKFPAKIRLSAARIGWRLSDIMEWMGSLQSAA